MIGIIGDYNSQYPLHRATTSAISAHSEVEWLATDRQHELTRYRGFLCSPGSPYRSMQGALDMIRFARTQGVPFLGTCGGYQHAVLEFARNVMEIREAQHEEYEPSAATLFVSRLACSLVGQQFEILIEPGTRAASAYPALRARENYYCNFGLNPAYLEALQAAGMQVAGRDEAGEPRILELPSHPFFVATLFVPQSRPGHPLVEVFLRHAGGDDSLF